MMDLKIFFLASLFVCTFAGGPHRKDAEQRRVPRSTFFIGAPPGPPGPSGPPQPPPPIFFRTNNWSGVARNADGSAQGVVSGAAAAAESAAPTFGAAGAYSVAASGGSDSSASSFGAQSGEACCGNQQQVQHTVGHNFERSGKGGNNGDESNQYSQHTLSSGGGGHGFTNGQSSFDGQKYSKNYKESHFLYQNNNGHFGGHGSNVNEHDSSSNGGQVNHNGPGPSGHRKFEGGQNGGSSLTQQQTSGFSATGNEGTFGGRQSYGGKAQHTSLDSSNSGTNGLALSQQQSSAFGSGGRGIDISANSKSISGSHGGSQFARGKQQESSFESSDSGNERAGFSQKLSHGQSENSYSSNSHGSGSPGVFDAGEVQSSSLTSGDISSKYHRQSSGGSGGYGGQVGLNSQGSISNEQQQAQSGLQLSAGLRGNGGVEYGDVQRNAGGQSSFGVDSGLTQQSGFGTSSILGGALNLASQGLDAARDVPGCSTCGKGSYALSNAKAHTGNAVALSIGG